MAAGLPIEREESVRNVVTAGALLAGPVRVEQSAGDLEELIRKRSRELAQRFAGTRPGELEHLVPARRLYRAFGIDPTRTRPSSEALLRRLVRGKPFPRISNAVDLCNLLALELWLPLGLYDAEKIEGPVVLRRGLPGEWYEGLGKPRVNLEGRPVLADGRGPFGNPTSDSARTSVGRQTRELLLVIFAPADYPEPKLRDHLDLAAEWHRRFLPCEAGFRTDTWIVA